MEKLSSNSLMALEGGITMGCALYGFQVGIVAGIAGAASGGFAAGFVVGALMSVDNPCNS